MISLKDGFIIWRQSQKEDFLPILYCLVSGHGANPVFFNKKIKIERPEQLLTPPPYVR